jgi:hypothetical protein
MIVIREQQLAVLTFDADTDWCVGKLAALYPPFAASPPAEQRQWTSDALERALKFRIERREYLQYLAFEQTFLPAKVDQPSLEWARRILQEPGKSSTDRMKRLRRETIRYLLELEARQEAERALAEEEPA